MKLKSYAQLQSIVTNQTLTPSAFRPIGYGYTENQSTSFEPQPLDPKTAIPFVQEALRIWPTAQVFVYSDTAELPNQFRAAGIKGVWRGRKAKTEIANLGAADTPSPAAGGIEPPVPAGINKQEAT